MGKEVVYCCYFTLWSVQWPPQAFLVDCSCLTIHAPDNNLPQGQWLWHSCQSGCFQHQRDQVRIQSSAIFYWAFIYCFLFRKDKEKSKRGWKCPHLIQLPQKDNVVTCLTSKTTSFLLFAVVLNVVTLKPFASFDVKVIKSLIRDLKLQDFVLKWFNFLTLRPFYMV